MDKMDYMFNLMEATERFVAVSGSRNHPQETALALILAGVRHKIAVDNDKPVSEVSMNRVLDIAKIIAASMKRESDHAKVLADVDRIASESESPVVAQAVEFAASARTEAIMRTLAREGEPGGDPDVQLTVKLMAILRSYVKTFLEHDGKVGGAVPPDDEATEMAMTTVAQRAIVASWIENGMVAERKKE